MLELVILPILVIGIFAYVTWLEIKSNRPFNWACIDGLANGIAFGIVYICIIVGSRG